MRADRRRRREAEELLPVERRPKRRIPQRPITFQLRETLFAFLVWFALVAAFNAFIVGLGPVPNVGIAIFAAFMLATLTVTGRHMMFRLTEALHPIRSLADQRQEFAACLFLIPEAPQHRTGHRRRVLLLDAAHHHAEMPGLDHHAHS